MTERELIYKGIQHAVRDAIKDIEWGGCTSASTTPAELAKRIWAVQQKLADAQVLLTEYRAQEAVEATRYDVGETPVAGTPAHHEAAHGDAVPTMNHAGDV